LFIGCRLALVPRFVPFNACLFSLFISDLD